MVIRCRQAAFGNLLQPLGVIKPVLVQGVQLGLGFLAFGLQLGQGLAGGVGLVLRQLDERGEGRMLFHGVMLGSCCRRATAADGA